MQEERIAKIQFGKNGQGYRSTRITLPVPWVDELGITENHRDVKISIKKNKIIIEKSIDNPTTNGVI